MKTKDYIIKKATDLINENFNIYEAAKVFNIDYNNLCAYIKGRKTMPLKLAFEILDYLNAKVVIFRESR